MIAMCQPTTREVRFSEAAYDGGRFKRSDRMSRLFALHFRSRIRHGQKDLKAERSHVTDATVSSQITLYLATIRELIRVMLYLPAI
jgi:hypothetical protein